MTKQEITAKINEVYDAVEASKLGTIYVDDGNGKQVFNTIAYNAFYYILQAQIPNEHHNVSEMVGKMDGKMTMAEPKESWES